METTPQQANDGPPVRCLVPDGRWQTACMQCPWGCGMEVEIEGGRIGGIRGNPSHPFSQGLLCPKAFAAPDVMRHPRRITRPMKRTGDEWNPIGWDEAYEILVTELSAIKERYGARALAVAIGMPVLLGGNSTVSFLRRFCDIYGTPNCFSVESICFRCQIIGRILTLGTYAVPDVTRSACVLVWGNNPDASAPPSAKRIREALANGARLIVIDPRVTPLAERADVHLQLRPGTDAALALGLMGVMISEGLYDREFVAQWTVGFEELARAAGERSLVETAEITGVPADQVEKAARLFAGASSACIVQGTNSLDQHVVGLQNSRCVAILQALTGNLDNPGGFVTTSKVKMNPVRLPERMEGEPLGADRYPLFNEVWGRNFGEGQAMLLADTILSGDPYPIRGLIVSASNPVITWPNGRKLETAMERLDFVAAMDLFLTPTTRRAHLFLPAATFLERVELCDYYGTLHGVPWVAARRKLFQVGEAISDLEFWMELGKRMGYEEFFPWADAAEALDHAVEPSGFTMADVLAREAGGMPFGQVRLDLHRKKGGFATPSGKVELFSQTLADLGHDGVPRHREPPESAGRASAGSEDLPLVLTTGARTLHYLHSENRDVERLARKGGAHPEAEVHPETARRWGVENGAWMEVESPQGSVAMVARVTDRIRPGVVSVPHGWEEASVNDITDDWCGDPVIGYPVLKSKSCRIRPKA